MQISEKGYRVVIGNGVCASSMYQDKAVDIHAGRHPKRTSLNSV